MRVLTVSSVSEDGERHRITVAPHHVKMVMAEENDVFIGKEVLKKVNLVFMDGEIIAINMSMMDLTTVEEAVGTYFLD